MPLHMSRYTAQFRLQLDMSVPTATVPCVVLVAKEEIDGGLDIEVHPAKRTETEDKAVQDSPALSSLDAEASVVIPAVVWDIFKDSGSFKALVDEMSICSAFSRTANTLYLDTWEVT